EGDLGLAGVIAGPGAAVDVGKIDGFKPP
ncbi:MAG: hypothetical protein CFH02_00922, partial [Alphaproteobacteria bacterium MarineAlpha3_Bin1]